MTLPIKPMRSLRDRFYRGMFAAGLIMWVLGVPLQARAITVTLNATQDSWMDQLLANQSVNHGAEVLLAVQGGSSPPPQQRRRSLLRFDLSSIPVCATVSSATLQLGIATAGSFSRTHGVHRLLKPWTESGVTWLKTDGTVSWLGGGANDASDSVSSASATASTGTVSGVPIFFVHPNLTTDVGTFVANPSANHGWLLRDEVEGGSPVPVTYHSRTGTVPPQLEVTYTLTDTNCDDANVCTTDTCGVGGCEYANNSLSCDDLLFCNGTDSCAGGACTHTGDPCPGPDGDTNCSESCDEAADNCSGADADGTPCRSDTGECDVPDTCLSGACPDAFEPGGTTCGNPTNTECDNADTCDGKNTCQANNESSGFPCGDATNSDCTNPDTCNGSGSCLANHESEGTPCTDDGETCTEDECNASGTCSHPAGNAGTECRISAGDCDVAESCDGSSVTCPADAKKPDATPCNDGLFCNGDDSCTAGTCSSHAGDVCSFICDEPTDQCITDGCPAGPHDSDLCRKAEKSQLKIKESATKRSLIWKFVKGNSTSFELLSDPTDTSDYTFCIYAGPYATLVGTLSVPHGSSWAVLGNNKGYRYSDPSGDWSGVQKIKLKASDRNGTKALIKGRDGELPDILGSMGLETPVKAQLLNHGSGACWEGNYIGTPKRNSATQFKAKQ